MEGVRTIDTPEGKIYYAQELAAILGIQKVSMSIKGFNETEIVSPEKRKEYNINTYKKYRGELRPNSKVILLTEKGACRLICNSRSVRANEVARLLGIDVRTRYEPKESETIRYIIDVFGNYPHELQYPVNIPGTEYRIDLYFPTLKLAIECDEDGHKRNDPIAEQKRETLISNALGCDFIRYNPDSDGFNIFIIIRQIHEYIVRSPKKM